MRTILLASFLMSAVALAGCGKKDSGSGAAPAPATGAAAGDGSPVCALVTQPEAAKLFGAPVGPGDSKAPGMVPTCRFAGDGDSGRVSVQYFADGTPAKLEQMKHIMKDPVAIAGAGTAAFRNSIGSTMAILANNHLVMVMATNLSSAQSSGDAADALAPVIAGRMH